MKNVQGKEIVAGMKAFDILIVSTDGDGTI